ncbi:MAG TPA: haloalkane dehalogenase [Burkholderiaceae bacterium]|nr:haloalkane dehalogenase [Burkholderiaceae bacterium]
MEKSFIDVIDGLRMAFTELGAGERTFLFLHGNPTSSFLWRSVMPAVSDLGRCVAPDLIGMGDSDKLVPARQGTYSFATHRDFLWRFIDRALPEGTPITLVLHDWGSALGFDWARHHAHRVRGIVYMEAIVRPLTWAEWPSASRAMFQSLRGDDGEQLILERNLFVERILPASVLRQLTADEMAEYRRPFASAPQHRWPTLEWPRQLPIDGEPSAVVAQVQAYADWMSRNQIPKLFVNAEPGVVLVGAQREFCRGWRNQTEVTVSGLHFVQEDSGRQIGDAIARWARG